MTFAKFATLVRAYTRTNSTTFTDAEILNYANVFKDEIAEDVVKADEDYFGMRFLTDLDAGVREYPLPSEVMSHVKYIEAKLDGTNWKKLKVLDLLQYRQTTDEATITAAFAGKTPAYDLWDGSLFIFSDSAIEDVTNGLKLWAIIWPADFTDLSLTTDMSANPSTTSNGFPRQLHELLARRISIAYKSSKDRPIPLSDKEKMYDDDLERKIASMKDQSLEQELMVEAPYNDGSDY